MEPRERGDGFEFVNKIVGGSIPREYIPAVEQGVREAMETGVLAGYPGGRHQGDAGDGSFHEVDSSEMAFKIAGSHGPQGGGGARRARPAGAVMKVEVTTPEEFMGDVMGDLNARRGQIEGMELRANAQVIRAMVPLAEMFGYVDRPALDDPGRATYSMEFAHYEPVSASVAEEVLAKARVSRPPPAPQEPSDRRR